MSVRHQKRGKYLREILPPLITGKTSMGKKQNSMETFRLVNVIHFILSHKKSFREQ